MVARLLRLRGYRDYGTVGPVKTQNGTKWHLWKHIQSCAAGGQYTAIYTDSSAASWNGQGHHQRALWANIFSLRKHFRCPGIKVLLCFPFSCLMAVIRFLLLWFLFSLRPFTMWVHRWLRPTWDMSQWWNKLELDTLIDCGSTPAPLVTSQRLKTIHEWRLVWLYLVLVKAPEFYSESWHMQDKDMRCRLSTIDNTHHLSITCRPRMSSKVSLHWE